MADVFIDTEACFAAVGALREALAGAGAATVIAVPDVGDGGATEALAVVTSLAGNLPVAAGAQLELVANAITLGAMDTLRADNPCVAFEG